MLGISAVQATYGLCLSDISLPHSFVCTLLEMLLSAFTSAGVVILQKGFNGVPYKVVHRWLCKIKLWLYSAILSEQYILLVVVFI